MHSLSGAAAARRLGSHVKKEEMEDGGGGGLEELGEEDPLVGGSAEWNADLDGAEAVTRKGWAGNEDEGDDERDFEGEEEEEAAIVKGEEGPEDEFDLEEGTAEGALLPRVTSVRGGVKMEPSDDYEEQEGEPDVAKMERVHKITGLHPTFKDYDFGTSKHIWCSITLNFAASIGVRFDLESLISAEVDKAIVYSLKNIERAFLDTDKPDHWVMRTEGINFEEVFREPSVFDLRKVYTNSIHHMMNLYGVEAARACLCKEVRDVFKHYGIDVDPRHLSLVADYMTQAGGYRAFNRHGMAGHPSLLQRMSFETSTNVLKEAILMDQSDSLAAPSAALILGQLPQHARRVFDLVGRIDD